MVMRYEKMKNKKNNLLYDVVFCLMILVVVATQVALGISGIIYLPDLGLTSKFWIAIFNICLYSWTISSSILFLSFAVISIQLIISDIKSYKNRR